MQLLLSLLGSHEAGANYTVASLVQIVTIFHQSKVVELHALKFFSELPGLYVAHADNLERMETYELYFLHCLESMQRH